MHQHRPTPALAVSEQAIEHRRDPQKLKESGPDADKNEHEHDEHQHRPTLALLAGHRTPTPRS